MLEQQIGPYLLRSDGPGSYAFGIPYTNEKTGQVILTQAKYYPTLSSALTSLSRVMVYDRDNRLGLADYIKRLEETREMLVAVCLED